MLRDGANGNPVGIGKFVLTVVLGEVGKSRIENSRLAAHQKYNNKHFCLSLAFCFVVVGISVAARA